MIVVFETHVGVTIRNVISFLFFQIEIVKMPMDDYVHLEDFDKLSIKIIIFYKFIEGIWTGQIQIRLSLHFWWPWPLFFFPLLPLYSAVLCLLYDKS